jgi:phage terminase small subunit
MSDQFEIPDNPTSLEDFKLTPFQTDFVVQYLTAKNPTEAVRKAGSKSVRPENLAHKLLKNPNIQAAIEFGLRNRIESAGIDSKAVVTMLNRVYESAMANGKFNDANKAAELLGSHLGMFRTAQIQEAKQKSETHRSSDDVKALKSDVDRLLATLRPTLK